MKAASEVCYAHKDKAINQVKCNAKHTLQKLT